MFTPACTAGYFQSLGLPAALAYLTIAVELLGEVALIAGFRTRIVALALVPVMLGAAFFGHGAAGFFFSNPNGGWEFPAWDSGAAGAGAAGRWCLCGGQALNPLAAAKPAAARSPEISP